MNRICALLSCFLPFSTLCAVEFPDIQLTEIATGLNRPVLVTHAGDGSGRIFVVERDGIIKIIKNGVITGTFLDIDARVTSNKTSDSNEQGLLGLAFPPDFINKQWFYVNYIDAGGDTVVSRFRVSDANPDVADDTSEEIILTQNQTASNHNGGHIAFSPIDHFLYIGFGDGGSANDPQNQAQNRSTFSGKMLRIDVETVVTNGYTIPSNNPFVADSSTLNEIWAIGLRNPWRWSFDRLTGDLFIGDVGQNEWEEVDFQAAASLGGENYGWKIMEGDACRPGGPDPCSQSGLTNPIHVYNNNVVGRSITGGYIHRGSEAWTRMHGCYFYADYLYGKIWALKKDDLGVWQNHAFIDDGNLYSSFGEDELGNVYVCRYGTSGSIHRIDDMSVYPDRDNDQLPDEWELFYGLSTNDMADAGIDSDLDGMVNSNEYLAGTAPNDIDSVLKFNVPSTEIVGNTITLTWKSAIGKAYNIYTIDLDAPGLNRSVVATNVLATPPQNSYSRMINLSGRAVYQVEAIDP